MLLNWLEEHIEQFRPLPNEGLNSFTHIKPLGELVLILYSLKTPYGNVEPAVRLWSEKIAPVLFERIEKWGEDIEWRNLTRAAGDSSEKLSALLMFPAGNRISGKQSRWLPQVQNVFSACDASTIKYTEDVLFARDLAGLGECREEVVSQLQEVLQKKDDIRMQTSTLYLVTHYVFFATEMGHRSCGIDGKAYTEVCLFLNKALENALLRCNYDLVSELLMCLQQVRAAYNQVRQQAQEELVKVVLRNGWIPGNHDGKIRDGDPFLQHYHACLMGLSALGQHPAISTFNYIENE